MNKENLFLKIVTYAPLFFIPLFISVISFVFIDMYNKSFQKNLEKVEDNLYNLEKQAIKSKVQNMVDVITYEKSIIKNELEANVKNRVELAYDIAKTIYEENKDRKSQGDIKKYIKTALKALTWNNGESFIWIVDYDGTFNLAPSYLKHLEGSSIIDFQDANGRYVIQEEISICKNKGKGYLWDTFTKENETTQSEQIAFVQSFGHFNWYFGSAEYLDTATRKSNKRLFKSLKNIDAVNNGYIFLINEQGKILMNKTIPQYIGKNISDIDDNMTKNVVNKMLSSLKEKDRDYITYKWLNIQNNNVEDKYAFIQKIPETDWILGSGFYLSDIQDKMAKQKVDMYAIMYSKSNNILYLSFLIVLIALLVSYYVTKKLKESFSKYKKDIAKNNVKLKELNATLEDKVLQRTIKLELMSITDELTTLYNRKHYNDKIYELISLYKRYNTKFSIMMYDIDNFKNINDTYGHYIGDKVLIDMSKLVKSFLRKTDLLFRVGGEEFIILIPETDTEGSSLLAEKIRIKVAELNTIKDKQITISIGLTEVNDKDTEDSIFQRVDRLLYYSKYNGKNRISTQIIGDFSYSYYFDNDTKTLYEKISGTYMNMSAFKDTLMNEEYMIKYLECENIITDFTNLEMNFQHYQNEVIELFTKYKELYLKNLDSHFKNKKAASYIYKFDNVDSVEPFRELQSSFGVKSENFKKINDINKFIGFDTRKYFEMDANELTVCK